MMQQPRTPEIYVQPVSTPTSSISGPVSMFRAGSSPNSAVRGTIYSPKPISPATHVSSATESDTDGEHPAEHVVVASELFRGEACTPEDFRRAESAADFDDMCSETTSDDDDDRAASIRAHSHRCSGVVNYLRNQSLSVSPGLGAEEFSCTRSKQPPLRCQHHTMPPRATSMASIPSTPIPPGRQQRAATAVETPQRVYCHSPYAYFSVMGSPTTQHGTVMRSVSTPGLSEEFSPLASTPLKKVTAMEETSTASPEPHAPSSRNEASAQDETNNTSSTNSTSNDHNAITKPKDPAAVQRSDVFVLGCFGPRAMSNLPHLLNHKRKKHRKRSATTNTTTPLSPLNNSTTVVSQQTLVWKSGMQPPSEVLCKFPHHEGVGTISKCGKQLEQHLAVHGCCPAAAATTIKKSKKAKKEKKTPSVAQVPFYPLKLGFTSSHSVAKHMIHRELFDPSTVTGADKPPPAQPTGKTHPILYRTCHSEAELVQALRPLAQDGFVIVDDHAVFSLEMYPSSTTTCKSVKPLISIKTYPDAQEEQHTPRCCSHLGSRSQTQTPSSPMQCFTPQRSASVDHTAAHNFSFSTPSRREGSQSYHHMYPPPNSHPSVPPSPLVEVRGTHYNTNAVGGGSFHTHITAAAAAAVNTPTLNRSFRRSFASSSGDWGGLASSFRYDAKTNLVATEFQQ